MDPSGEKIIDVVRAGLEKACEEFTERIRNSGFSRTKKMVWSRVHAHTVDFIHFHRSGSSYGSPRNFSVDIRVHFGIRVLGDSSPVMALNGPWSDSELIHAGKYHLRFNAKSGSAYERCADDLVRFLMEQGEPWFLRFRDPRCLIEQKDSPLRLEEAAFLDAALHGEVDGGSIATSKKLLGIKTPKK